MSQSAGKNGCSAGGRWWALQGRPIVEEVENELTNVVVASRMSGSRQKTVRVSDIRLLRCFPRNSARHAPDTGSCLQERKASRGRNHVAIKGFTIIQPVPTRGRRRPLAKE